MTGTETGPNTDALRHRLVDAVAAQAKLAQVLNDSLFSYSELGFQETESSALLARTLESAGFAVERGTAGIPTSFAARWGEGGPLIALGSDIDALPNVSQKPGIAWHEPLVEGGPGHGEGHNSGMAVCVAAAIALKEVMQRDGIAGRIMVWPGIAEELLAGKSFQVRAGMFAGVDACLFTHVGSNLETGWGEVQGQGMISVEYTFRGESAHAAAAPWRGRSALDAVELMNMGWNMRREHLRPQQRSHYVITYGGEQPNVVPSLARVWYYIRETDNENLRRNFAIANRIADAAAQMTDTRVERRVLGTAYTRHYNRPIAEAMQAQIERVGLPAWTADDQEFARAVQRAAGGEQSGLATTMPPLATSMTSGGSDDIGDVSWTVPTVQLRYPANIPHLPGHHWSCAMAMATPIAHRGIIAGAKVVALTALELMLRPELVAQARRYFSDVQCKDAGYVPFLDPADPPPVHMNGDTMARFAPALRALHYDPARFETYLDQLGVRYPTLAPE